MEMSQQKYIGASCYLLNKTALLIHSYSVYTNILSINKLEKGSTVLSCQCRRRAEWEQQIAKERNEITHLKG